MPPSQCGRHPPGLSVHQSENEQGRINFILNSRISGGGGYNPNFIAYISPENFFSMKNSTMSCTSATI